MLQKFALATLVAALLGGAGQAADDNSDWGTIKGRVVLAGADAVPEPVTLKVDKDQNHCLSKGPLTSEELVVNKSNRGVRWVLVWLKPATGGLALKIHPNLKKIKQKEVEIDQPCCMFTPHAMTIRQGQVLVAKNSSPIAHNTHWTGNPLQNPGGNIIVPAKGQIEIKDLQAQRLPMRISCDIHPWMGAYVGIFDHPYHTVTDENGNFEIKHAPAGDYQLIVWQEKTGWVLPGRADGMKIAIKGGGETDAGKIELKPQ